GQLRLRPLDFLVIDPRTKMLVFSYHYVAHIEPHRKILFGYDNRGFRAEGVPHAKLEKRIDVGGRQICDDQVRGQQALVHGHVDDTGVLDLVGAFARVSGRLGCRLDDVSVSFIEIEILVLLEIGLLAVAHNHKATGHGVLHVWPRARMRFRSSRFGFYAQRLADVSINTLTRRIATAAAFTALMAERLRS